MKTITSIIFVIFAISVIAQENKTDQRIHGANDKFADDVIIQSSPTINQEKVKLSVAFNGWIYAAFSTIDSSTNSGGITIMKSLDNGYSWQVFDSYQPADIRYPAFDIVVVGTDTNDLTLYLIGVNYSLSSFNYTVFLDKYNARTNTYIGSNYNKAEGMSKIYDVAISSDYNYPSLVASPYSVAFIYSKYGMLSDSINFILSEDGGGNFAQKTNIATTTAFFNKVSLAYGRSFSGSNGRYFAAWERKASLTSRNGNIYTSRNMTQINGSWITPVCLDSISPGMIGLCTNPSISASISDTDNDSSGVTAIVMVQRDYNQDATDHDLLGFYNKRAHFNNNWFRFDVDNSNTNAMQPNISYDMSNNNFLLTYFDSTNLKLPYLVNGFNMTNPGMWTTISEQYNDNTNIKSPYPVVKINPSYTKTVHAWTAIGSGNKGIAMFDAEYKTTSINEAADVEKSNVYPNPARTEFSLALGQNDAQKYTITIFDVNGKEIEKRVAQNSKGGNYIETFNVGNWENGLYLIQVQSENSTYQDRVVVLH